VIFILLVAIIGAWIVVGIVPLGTISLLHSCGLVILEAFLRADILAVACDSDNSIRSTHDELAHVALITGG
jgi:hypothetical protein